MLKSGSVLLVYILIVNFFCICFASVINNKLKRGDKFEDQIPVPEQFISGEMHYFRVPHEYWRDRLEKMKLGGVNIVSTPINWFVHNPEYGEEYWDGSVDLVHFLDIVKDLKMQAILKIGPFIDADLDFGGLQPWFMWTYSLTTDFPWIRSTKVQDAWEKILLNIKFIICPRILNYFHTKGGPIIMLQIEQDFGHESGQCVFSEYIQSIIKSIHRHCQFDGILYTSDVNSRDNLLCGRHPLLKTSIHLRNVILDNKLIANYHWNLLKRNYKEVVNESIPFFVSDIPSGRTLSWHDERYLSNYEVINDLIKTILQSGASLNYYMYVGGTNFGFLAGNSGEFNQGYITSYDNNAPITEYGELTVQFYNLRNLIHAHFNKRRYKKIFIIAPSENDSIMNHHISPALARLPQTNLEPIGCLLCETVKQRIARPNPLFSKIPLTFRELSQTSGFVLYETRLQFQPISPCSLECIGVVDRGYVYFRYIFVGYLNHYNRYELILEDAALGDILQILVESNGRLSHGFRINMDIKGITEPVYLDGHLLTNWTMYQYPFNFAARPKISKDIEKLFKYAAYAKPIPLKVRTPMLYRGTFFMDNYQKYPDDRYIDMTGWGKGVIFINGINLGRYWSKAGPQLTLYLPGCFLKLNGLNTLIILELERPPKAKKLLLKFEKSPIFRSAAVLICNNYKSICMLLVLGYLFKYI